MGEGTCGTEQDPTAHHCHTHCSLLLLLLLLLLSLSSLFSSLFAPLSLHSLTHHLLLHLLLLLLLLFLLLLLLLSPSSPSSSTVAEANMAESSGQMDQTGWTATARWNTQHPRRWQERETCTHLGESGRAAPSPRERERRERRERGSRRSVGGAGILSWSECRRKTSGGSDSCA